MRLTTRIAARYRGNYEILKVPAVDAPPAQRDPDVAARVSEMLRTIEAGGMDAVLAYARDLDGWTGTDIELDGDTIARAGDLLSSELRAALEMGARRTRAFAAQQRARLTDFEVELEPGLVAGQRYLPVDAVGAYLPAGRFPLVSSAFMTVGVAKSAGVGSVLACTPPQAGGDADPAVLHAAYLSGANRVFVLGGVQALAAMAFGLLDDTPVDMIVGAGNAYVAEAKRQLFGTVAIDLPAGPSEVAVIADETADAELVAADLLGQAEHGVNSPAALVTTCAELARAVVDLIDTQLRSLSTRDIAGAAWRDYGSIFVASDRDVAIALMDDLAPEHLEVNTGDDEYYFSRLTSYGSVFLGQWSTVAYSDKGMAGTNHVLPTARGARHSAGLSVSRFLKPLTFQRVQREATPLLAEAVATISAYEGMAAHRATATMRLDAFGT